MSTIDGTASQPVPRIGFGRPAKLWIGGLA